MRDYRRGVEVLKRGDAAELLALVEELRGAALVGQRKLREQALRRLARVVGLDEGAEEAEVLKAARRR